jgi:hypothetical protein
VGPEQKDKDNMCFLTHNNPGGPEPGTPGIPACISGVKVSVVGWVIMLANAATLAPHQQDAVCVLGAI